VCVCVCVCIYISNTPFPVTRHKNIMKCDKDILQPFFEDLIYGSPDNQLPLYKLSKSDPLTNIKYVCNAPNLRQRSNLKFETLFVKY
jgi:hypothetical protein